MTESRTDRERHGEFECIACDATVFSFVETRDPPSGWRWHPDRNGWKCEECSKDDAA